MQKRQLRLQLYFDNAMYVSANEEPDQLRITINDRSLFVSTTNMPLASIEEIETRSHLLDGRYLQFDNFLQDGESSEEDG